MATVPSLGTSVPAEPVHVHAREASEIKGATTDLVAGRYGSLPLLLQLVGVAGTLRLGPGRECPLSPGEVALSPTCS